MRQRLSYELLEARPGRWLLDVGCGIGDDVRAIAALVGPGGAAVGLDKSEVLLAEARSRSAGLEAPGSFVQGDMHALPFADATFDGCRAERVLLHSDRPERVVAEMARVTRPGGVLVVTEPDLDTIVFHASNREAVRTLTHWHCDSVRNGTIGRRLPEIFYSHGLEDVRIVPTATHTTEPSNYACTLVVRAREAGALTPQQADDILADWEARAAQGLFLEFGLFLTVAGRTRERS